MIPFFTGIGIGINELKKSPKSDSGIDSTAGIITPLVINKSV